MMSGEDNITQQCDEIEALTAIYGDDFSVVDEYQSQYSISVTVDQQSLNLVVTLPPEYPSNSPPRYDIDALWLRGARRDQLHTHLDNAYLDHVGECILYVWGERVREFLQELADVEAATKHVADMIISETPSSTAPTPEEECIPCPEIASGELIIDRKSVFQPHLARVTATQQVPVVLNKLKENRKIATATHNIWAYRIALESGTMAQDCEDDGETKAGSRMLHLMGVLNVVNVLVIVTRWYGGCHLGPDRFKHINTATRSILEQCGLLGGREHQKTTSADTSSAGAVAPNSAASKKTKYKVK